MMNMPRLVMDARLLDEMTAHTQVCLPEEACGLLGGKENRLSCFYPVENRLHSPVRFQMEPQQQWQAFIALEQAGLELLAIMHSHPTGPQAPSPTDLAEFTYPGVYYLIVSPGDYGWQVKAWQIETGIVIPVEIMTE
jgi:proteasome lid subunit RPN8/RPN11